MRIANTNISKFLGALLVLIGIFTFAGGAFFIVLGASGLIVGMHGGAVSAIINLMIGIAIAGPGFLIVKIGVSIYRGQLKNNSTGFST